MNTILKFLALVLAAAVPAVFVAQAVGFAVPSAVDTSSLLTAFVAVLVFLTMAADYRRARPLSTRPASVLATATRSNYRLAA